MQIAFELFNVQSEFPGIANQTLFVKVGITAKEEAVHFPETILNSRRLGGLRDQTLF